MTTGIDQISAVIQTNSATAEESAATSEELSGQSQVLKELVGKFQLMQSTPVTDQISETSIPNTVQAPLPSFGDKY